MTRRVYRDRQGRFITKAEYLRRKRISDAARARSASTRAPPAKKRAAPARVTPAKKRAAPARSAPAKKRAAPVRPAPAKKRAAPARPAPARVIPAKKRAAPARVTPAKKRAAPSRVTPAKKRAAPSPPTTKVYRDERGRFITKSEYLQRKLIEKAKRKIERELAALKKKEREEAEKKFKIPESVAKAQEALVRKIAKAIKATSVDLRVEVEGGLADPTRFEAQIVVSGLTPFIDDEDKARDELTNALMAATLSMPRRKGMLIQIALVPNETILAKYGREGGLMTSRWMHLGADEHEFLSSRGREMLEAMIRNGWALVGLRLSLVYDRRVAKKKG